MAISRVILGVLLPPVGVCIDKGVGSHFIINILLFIFTVWIGAIIHAFHIYGVDISTNLLCLFLPPVGVLMVGSFGEFCVCLLLTLLAWFPGVIYAYYIALRRETGK